MIVEKVLKKNMHLALSWNSVTGCLPWLSTCKKRFTTEKAVQVVEMWPYTKHPKAGSIPIKRKMPFSFKFQTCISVSSYPDTLPSVDNFASLDSQRNKGNYIP